MKKLLAFLMIITVVLSLSVSAFAGVGSVTAPKVSSESTADVPQVLGTHVQLTAANDEELSPEAAEKMESAFSALESAAPEGFSVRNFCYAAADSYPYETTLIIDDASDVIIMVFVNGEWVEVEVIDNGNGMYTFTLEEEGPVAICTK